MKEETYEVRGTGNKLFCKCHDEDGEKILVTGDGHSINFASLQRQVFSPQYKGRRSPRAIHHKKVV